MRGEYLLGLKLVLSFFFFFSKFFLEDVAPIGWSRWRVSEDKAGVHHKLVHIYIWATEE